MNTWRDIKEAPLNQAVFATDGNMVFFGRFAMTADRRCMFEGQDIEEACNYDFEPACLTGWQPVPDTWKPEKSADEMFREMGYYPAEFRCTEIGYEHTEEPERVKFLDDGVWFEDDGWCMKVGNAQILAAAQKIREMDANNG